MRRHQGLIQPRLGCISANTNTVESIDSLGVASFLTAPDYSNIQPSLGASFRVCLPASHVLATRKQNNNITTAMRIQQQKNKTKKQLASKSAALLWSLVQKFVEMNEE